MRRPGFKATAVAFAFAIATVIILSLYVLITVIGTTAWRSP